MLASTGVLIAAFSDDYDRESVRIIAVVCFIIGLITFLKSKKIESANNLIKYCISLFKKSGEVPPLD